MLFKFVAGNNINKVLSKSKIFLNKKTIPIINYISESNINNNINFIEYKKLIDNVNNNYIIALKLSSLNFQQTDINKICNLCQKKNIKLIIDAENDKNIEEYRKITNSLLMKYNKNDLNIIKTYQMYRKDSILECLANSSRSSFLLADTATFQPSLANFSATDFPIPLLAPVIQIFFCFSDI